MIYDKYVNDTCKVIKTWPVLQSSRTKKKKEGSRDIGKGTRVFKYEAVDYCNPYYVHNDGQWAVYFCFDDVDLDKIVKILKQNPGDKEVFVKNKDLAEYGGFYSLQDYENFGKLNLGEKSSVKAVYYITTAIRELENTKMNGNNWTPTAEVIQRLAVTGSRVVPMGLMIAEDDPDSYPTRFPKRGYPNVMATNPNLLDKQPAPHGMKWTEMTVHVHPIGRLPEPLNSTADCGKDSPEIFTAKFIDSDTKIYHQGPQNPSPADLDTQFGKQESQERNKDQKRKRYRSVIVDRYYIRLYIAKNNPHTWDDTRYNYKEMYIKRQNPDIKYDPKP